MTHPAYPPSLYLLPLLAALAVGCGASTGDDDDTSTPTEAATTPSPTEAEQATMTPSPSEAASPTASDDEGTPTAPLEDDTPTGDEPSPSPSGTPSDDDSLVPSARCAVDGDRHVSWGEITHDNDTDPMYDTVFDLTTIKRMDIRMNPSDFEGMQAELEELLGEFGAGGNMPGGGGPGEGGPPDGIQEVAQAACEELSSGDSCTFEIDDMSVTGTCIQGMGALECRPEGGPGEGGPGGEEGGDTDLVDEDPSFFPVEVEVDGDVWCQVGFRRKGNSTLSIAWSQGVAKLPFRLDFDEFEDDHPETKNQRFFGFKKMTFGNGYGDATYIREVMATEIMRDRGLPAARNAFVRVYLDHGEGPEYHGLYTMMEDPDDAMMDEAFGDDDGNLYKPQGDCANLTCFDEDSFSKESNDDEADWSDVQALVSAVNADTSDAAQWRADLEATLDVQTFLKWLAINTVIENWDTYGVMAQNYYLYGLPADGGRLTWFPWDLNLSLMNNERSPDLMHTTTSDTWPLIRNVLDDEVYMEDYVGYLPQALEGAFAVETFSARATELHTLIAPYVVGEDGEVAPYTFMTTDQAFWDALDGDGGLIEHVESRHAVVNAALAQ